MTQELPITQTIDSRTGEQPIVTSGNFCPVCGTAVTSLENFCPHCGTKLQKVDMPLGFGRKLYIYTIAVVGPPFGLIWFFKYFRSPNADIKRVAYISLILTVLSIIITLWATISFFQGLQGTYNTYTNLGI